VLELVVVLHFNFALLQFAFAIHLPTMFRNYISDVEDNYAHQEHTNILIGEFLTFQSQTCS
jgi:hypothetical protein